MVHALEEVHTLLRTHGVLVNIHSLPAPTAIEVCTPARVIKAGWASDKTNFASELAGFDALFQVVADGLFLFEDERYFEHRVHTASYQEFREWLSNWWESAILPESVDQRIVEAIREANGQVEIVTIIPARMTKLRAAGL